MEWCEFEDSMRRPVRQQAKHVTQVAPRLEAERATARKERREDSVDARSVIAVHKQLVFTTYRLAPEIRLTDVVKNGKPPVFERAR